MMSMYVQSGLWNVETVTTGLTIEVEHHRQFSIFCWLMLHSSASHHFSVRSTEMSCQKFIFSNIEISNDDIEPLQRYAKMLSFCARFSRLCLWKASFPPVVDKHSTTSTAWNSPLSRTTYTHNWHSKHDGVENASPFKYGYVTMLGIYGKFQGYLTWDKDKRGQFSTIQRSNMQDPSTRPRPPLSHMGDSSTSKSKRSFIIGRLANRLLRLFGNAN